LEFSSQEIGSSSNELTIDKIIKLAKKNQFPKKLITIANEEHYYTATLIFFEFVDKYTKIPEENVEFKCKICNNTFHAVIGKTRNLNKHLKTYENFDEWHQKYSSSNKQLIEKRLKQASTVCLLTDLWSNTQTTDFIGLCGVLTSHPFEREILVIDMMRMPGKRHTAENIKFAIERMVNINTKFFFLIRIVYLR
jgi:hypothetical protein